MHQRAWHRATLSLLILSITGYAVAACTKLANVQCEDDSNCNLGGGGVCAPAASGNRWCAYPDPQCQSGYRYSTQAVGDDVSGVCVATEINPGIPSIADWESRFGGPGNDQGLAIAVARNGDVVVAGTFTKTLTLGGPAITSAADSQDVYVARYTADGHYLWSVSLGGTDTDYLHGIATDSNGDVYVTGSFAGPVNFGGGTRAIPQGAFLVKLAATSGVYKWDISLPSTDSYAVALLSSDTVVVSGTFSGTVDFGGGNRTAMGDEDTFLAAYTTGGAHIWSNALSTSGGFPAREWGHIAPIDEDILVTAGYAGTATLDQGVFSSYGTEDALVARYRGANGAQVWAKSLTQSGSQIDGLSPSSIASDGKRVIVSGIFSGTKNVGGRDMVATGRGDAFVVSMDASDGTYMWSQRFGGTAVTDAASLSASSSRLAMALEFSSETIVIGTQSYTAAANDTDTAIVKLNPSTGVPILTSLFGSPAPDNMALVYGSDRLLGVGTFGKSVDLFGTTLTSSSESDLDIALFRVDF
jgi:hypothetical protein